MDRKLILLFYCDKFRLRGEKEQVSTGGGANQLFGSFMYANI